MAELEARWARTWRVLGATPPAGLWVELMARYAEPHRAYHTARHLGECFAALEPASHLAARPAEVEAAIWFHDAIYDPPSHDNEARSARWAQDALLRAGVDVAAAGRVHAMVLATQHTAVSDDADTRLLVDVDLSILGAEPARFDEYERQIRFEYAWVPEPDFRAGRSRILAGLLERSSIYGTAWFAGRLQARARANLTRSLAHLNAQGGDPR
jgi:predicted metal-dependent HD superfamily phosphohydrolase